jgi:hypothetical protein
MNAKFLLTLSVFVVCGAAAAAASKTARADDPDALAATVAHQGQIIGQLQAKLIALEADMASCKARIGEC